MSSWKVIFVALFVLCAAITTRLCTAQMLDDDVSDLTLTDINSTTSRLTWTAVPEVPCEYSITYSVFRSSKEDFEPSAENQVANGIIKTTYVVHDPQGESYYHVRAVRHSLYCSPPMLTSGRIIVFPLDLGNVYQVTVGSDTENCTASSTSELICKTLPRFHATLASQRGHEFLIGCLDSDYEGGAWSCVNLTVGAYLVAVHSKTVSFFNAGFSKQNTRTGKTLSSIIPVFSVLGTIY